MKLLSVLISSWCISLSAFTIKQIPVFSRRYYLQNFYVQNEKSNGKALKSSRLCLGKSPITKNNIFFATGDLDTTGEHLDGEPSYIKGNNGHIFDHEIQNQVLGLTRTDAQNYFDAISDAVSCHRPGLAEACLNRALGKGLTVPRECYDKICMSYIKCEERKEFYRFFRKMEKMGMSFRDPKLEELFRRVVILMMPENPSLAEQDVGVSEMLFFWDKMIENEHVPSKVLCKLVRDNIPRHIRPDDFQRVWEEMPRCRGSIPKKWGIFGVGDIDFEPPVLAKGIIEKDDSVQPDWIESTRNYGPVSDAEDDPTLDVDFQERKWMEF